MTFNKKHSLVIGIDVGVKTGFAVWNRTTKRLDEVKTTTIDKAWQMVLKLKENNDVLLVIEDARKRKWYGKNAKNKQQGAGAIKVQCGLWETFCKNNSIEYKLVHPIKGMTKLDKQQFAKITGYTGQSSSHSRDATMLVYQYN